MDERTQFALAILSEYARLLELRVRLEAQREDHKAEMWLDHDRHELSEIRNRIVPEVRAGRFAIEVHGGMIAVELSDRRYPLRAPNGDWDQEMKQRVIADVVGDRFAGRAFLQAERAEAERPEGGGYQRPIMSSDFTGTNPEKIDKLVATMVELRTTLRICFAIIGVGFPCMIGLLTFLVMQSFGTSSKIDRLSDQISIVKGDYQRLSDRLDRLERPGRP